MTFALVAISDPTYGGIYLADPFTTSGTQPTWVKLTTTGLPSLEPDIMRVDYNNPRNVQYLGFGMSGWDGSGGELYVRNGGNWSKILDETIASVVTGYAINRLHGLWTHPYDAEGVVYATAGYVVSALNARTIFIKSVDYGANWSVIDDFTAQTTGAYTNIFGDYIWCGVRNNLIAAAMVAGSADSGISWDSTAIAGAAGTPRVSIDWFDESRCYAWEVGTNIRDFDIVAPATLSNDTRSLPLGGGQDNLFVDQYTENKAYAISSSNLYYTSDRFVNVSTTNVGISNKIALTKFWNHNTSDIVFGSTVVSKIYHVDNETDNTPTDRSGANAGAPPYTDSIPDVGSVIVHGIWAGSAPVSTGVFVYSVEMEDGDNTWDNSLFSYDALGSPMGGDRSSFRDMYADGFDVYHAEDVHAATPQIHAPWPASSGEAPVSDGTKWVPTDIITQAEFDYSFYLPGVGHCPVTLDADAALILDLQGGCSPAQEIGLDVQQPTYVWMGPSFAPADEPTFQPMYIEQLANVTTTAPIGDGEVLTFDSTIGQWVNEVSQPSLDDLHEHIVNEDHSAECDGAETNFSTAYVFRANSTQVYLNGIRQYIGPSYYLEDGDLNGITFDTAPENDDILIMDYIVEYTDYFISLMDSESVDLIDSEGVALTDSEG